MASCESASPRSVRAAQRAQAAEVAKAARAQQPQSGKAASTSRIAAGVTVGAATGDKNLHMTGHRIVGASRPAGLMRLSSEAFASAPKTLLEHLRHMPGTGSRAKDHEHTEADALPFFESKVTSTYYSPTTVARSVTSELSTASADSLTEDSGHSPQNEAEILGQRQQERLSDQRRQNAFHSVQLQQQATQGQGGKDEVHTRKLVGELHCEQPRRGVVDQQRFHRKGNEWEEREEDVSTEEEGTAPGTATSEAPAGQKELHPIAHKAEHSRENDHVISSSIYHWDTDSNDGANDDFFSAIDTRDAVGRGGVLCNSTNSRANGSSFDKVRCDRGTKDANKRGGTVDASRKAAGVAGDAGVHNSGKQDSNSTEAGNAKNGMALPSDTSAYAPGDSFDESSRAGLRRASSESSLRLDGDAEPDVFRLPKHSDTAPTLLPSSAAYRSSCFPPLSALTHSSAASRGAATPTGRFRKGVGTRLSEMLLHSRSTPKLGASAKDGIFALRGSARNRRAPCDYAGTGANGVAADPGTDAHSSPTASTTACAGLSNKLPSPPLLRQLRRRARKKEARCAVAAPGELHGPDNSARGRRDDSEKETASVVAAAARTVQEADERPGKAGRTARGVLRQSRGQTKTGKGRGGLDADSPTEVAPGGGRTAIRRNAGRRVFSAGVSDTSVDSRAGQVKMVRFGSMSIHVYAREARIRSCSSDSLNFAVALDPVDSTSEWLRHRHTAESSVTRAGVDDSDYTKTHATYDDESAEEQDEGGDEEVDDEEDEEEEEEEEEERQEEVEDQDNAEDALWWLGERQTGLRRRAAAGESSGTDGVATTEEPHCPGVNELLAAVQCAVDTASTQRATPSGAISMARGWTGPLSEDENVAGEGTAAASAEGGSRTHSFGGEYGRSSSSSSSFERYPSIFEDLYGRPESLSSADGKYDSSGRLANTPVGWHWQQPTRGVVVQTRSSHDSTALSPLTTGDYGYGNVSGTRMPRPQLLDRQSSSAGYTTAGVAPAVLLAQGTGSSTEGVTTQDDDVLRETSAQLSAPPHGDAPERHVSLSSSSSSSSLSKAERRGRSWWKLLVSSSSSEMEEREPAVGRGQRRTTKREPPDEDVERGTCCTADSPTSTTRGVAAPSADGSFSTGNLPVVGEEVGINEGCVSDQAAVAESREKQRFKIGARFVKATQEEKTPGQDAGRVGEGNEINMQRTRSLKALFQKQIGWPELRTQNRAERKDTPPVEEVQQGTRRQLNPERFHSDEYSCSRSVRREPQRTQSEGVLRHEHGEEESKRPPLELKFTPLRLEKETSAQPSGRQAEPVRGTDRSPPTKEDKPWDIHVDQQPAHREKPSVQLANDRPLKSVQPDTEVSLPSISCCSTFASTGLESKSNSLTAIKGLPSHSTTTGSGSAELVRQQELHTGRDSNTATANLSYSVVGSTHSGITHPQFAAATNRPSVADAVGEQSDVPQEAQQRLLLQRHSLPQEELPLREHSDGRGSLTRVPSAGRNNSEEEILSKAAEEAIARSSTSMSVEEKETIKGILKGWCS